MSGSSRPSRHRAFLCFSALPLVLAGCASNVATPPAAAPTAKATPVAAAPAAPIDFWSVLTLGKSPCGRAHEVVKALDGGIVESSSRAELSIRQLGSSLNIAVDEDSTEDASGVLRASHLKVQTPSMTTVVEFTVNGKEASVKQTTGGAETVRSVHLDHDMMGGEELRRRTLASLHAAGDRIDFYTWSDDQSGPSNGHRIVDGLETVQIDGVATPAMRVTTSIDGGSSPVVTWLDAEGRTLRSETVVSFGTISGLRAKSEPPPVTEAPAADTIDGTMIRSNARLPEPRSLDRLVVRVTPIDATWPLPPLDGPGQKVIAQDARGAVLEIDRLPVPTANTLSSSGTDDAMLGVSGMIDPTAERVRAIVADVTTGESDPWAKAQKLVRWVAANMTYDPKVPIASAATVAKDLHGTCNAYATLLASLLRAAGIPSRSVAGVAYTGGMFAGHVWVEAKIGGAWLPLDATIGNVGTVDAARIAVGHDTSSPGGAVAQTKFLGHVKLAVLEYQAHGKHAVKVVEGKAPYAVEGQTYTNDGLGISLTLPNGSAYQDLDAVWPNPTFVTAKVGNDTVVLQEVDIPPVADFDKTEAAMLRIPSLAACKSLVVSGRKGCLVTMPQGDMVALNRGGSLLVVGAIGATGHQTLPTIAKSMRLSDK